MALHVLNLSPEDLSVLWASGFSIQLDRHFAFQADIIGCRAYQYPEQTRFHNRVVAGIHQLEGVVVQMEDYFLGFAGLQMDPAEALQNLGRGNHRAFRIV